MTEESSVNPRSTPIILAYDSIKDPRDLAEVLHLAAGFGAEVHLLGKSLSPSHWKVLRKLKSWRPRLAERPLEMRVSRLDLMLDWVKATRAQGFSIVGTVIEGGDRPGSEPASTLPRPRIAFLFGEETSGLSQEARAHCDHLWTLPLGVGGQFYTLGQATALILGGALVK